MTATKTPVPGCKGTTVQQIFSGDGVQVLRVEVQPDGEIPLHQHNCAAKMVIVQGRARALGKVERIAAKGDVIVKAANEPHGFTDVTEPFVFLSISDGDGIVKPDRWDMDFVPGGSQSR